MQMKRWISMFMVALVSVTLLFLYVGDVMALKVGDKAPDFTLSSTTGEKISLSQYQGKKPVVLYFYLFAFGGA
jgi:cytochrome oxidase Cu insertion factor (SCO1/SenC/PrrC family)